MTTQSTTPLSEQKVFDFETKFGNYFQPSGDGLHEAMNFIRETVAESISGERSKWVEWTKTWGAVPATTDYANGWNDCRKALFESSKDLLTKESK